MTENEIIQNALDILNKELILLLDENEKANEKIINAHCLAIESLKKTIKKYMPCPKGWKGYRNTRFFCPSCNKILKMDEKICNNCGQHLNKPRLVNIDNKIELMYD